MELSFKKFCNQVKLRGKWGLEFYIMLRAIEVGCIIPKYGKSIIANIEILAESRQNNKIITLRHRLLIVCVPTNFVPQFVI